MAPVTTHLVIGERVFPQLLQLEPADFGAFLLGCVMVDVHAFSSIDRRTTHFADRFDKHGAYAFDRSCTNFVDQLDDLLVRSWDELTCTEQAFVAGNLCHLAADENWKQFVWDVLHDLGISPWTDLPVPGDVILTGFDVSSNELYIDFPSVTLALSDASVPNLSSHVPDGAFQVMWDIIKDQVAKKSTLESILEFRRRQGKTNEEIQGIRHQLEEHWEDAEKVIEKHFGGIQTRVQAMVRQSLETTTRLWA